MSATPDSAFDIAAAVQSGSLSAEEVAESFAQRARNSNSALNALIDFDEAYLLSQAREIDATGEKGPLAGVPVVVKDNIQVAGRPLTCASRILDDYRSPFDATAIQRLKDAGAVILGKANLDEFAMGSSCEHSAFGPTKNPWDPERVPGGSSGGSAAAVAARFAPLSLGSDTGGSIRQPASFCGNVGIKPSYGSVSRYGLVAFGSSLDQIGPFSRGIRDSAMCLNAMAGPCAHDATSIATEWSPLPLSADPSHFKGLRVGYVPKYTGEGCDPSVAKSVEAALKAMEVAGATLVELDLRYSDFVVQVYYILATSEASSNLSRFDGVRYGLREEAEDLISQYANSRGTGFGPEVQRRIMLGTYALSAGYQDAYYKKARAVQALITKEYEQAFEKCDVIAGPTTPTTAFRLGENLDDPLKMYLCDIYTIGANLAGTPALSMPCGFDDSGLPIGLHLLAGYRQDPLLVETGLACEELLKVDKQFPPAFR